MLILIESGAFRWTGRLIGMLNKNKIEPKDDLTLNLDEDVIEEE